MRDNGRIYTRRYPSPSKGFKAFGWLKKVHRKGDEVAITSSASPKQEKEKQCMLDTGVDARLVLEKVNSFTTHLENCWIAQPLQNQVVQDFYAHLSSETGVPALKLRTVFDNALNSYLATVQEFLNEIYKDIERDGVAKITSLVKLFSYTLNFSIAYEDLFPDTFKQQQEDVVDTARLFLNSVGAFENYPEYVWSINTPVF